MQPFALTWVLFSTVKPKLKCVLEVTAAGGVKEGNLPQKHPLTYTAPSSGLSLALWLLFVNICF